MTHRLQTNHMYQQHAHQRQMMAMLGIDVWALREQPAQATTLSIFRDQSDDLASTFVPHHDHADLTTDTAGSTLSTNVDTTTQANAVSVTQHHSESTPPSLIHPNQTPITLEKNNIHSSVVEQGRDAATTELLPSPVEAEPAIEIAAFELQACLFERVILLVEVQQLSTEEAQLWANIRACQSSQLRVLTWPSPVSHFQDGHGVAAYVAGFVDALGQDLSILCLGESLHLSAIQKQQLPSLNDMLQQPLLKRALWQAIRQA